MTRHKPVPHQLTRGYFFGWMGAAGTVLPGYQAGAPRQREPTASTAATDGTPVRKDG